MMKLFKKKKSDKSISNTILQQDSRELDSSNVKKQTKPAAAAVAASIVTIPVATTTDARSMSPPTIVMPKPRRILTPTRAIMGRYDHDKTQIEEDDATQFIQQQEISPILLPTAREEPLSQLIRPFKSHITQPLQQQETPGVVSSHSTIRSDDSSRVYESALESLPDTVEYERVTGIPDVPLLKKRSIVNTHVPMAQQQQQQQQQQQLKQDILAIGVLSDSSSQTASPRHYVQPPLGSADHKQALTSTTTKHELQQPRQQPRQHHLPPPQPAQTLLVDQELKQTEERQLLLNKLIKQVGSMEKQRIKDREEWTRKEQELAVHRQQMMETLIETKDQLTNVLKSREEENNKAKLANYDKQLNQQQMHQLQNQVAEMALSQQQQQQQQQQEDDADDDEDDDPPARMKSNYYPQQYYYQDEQDDPLEENDMDEDEVHLYHQSQLGSRSKSEDYMKYHTRSASRSSHHYQQQQQQHADDGRRSSNSRTTYNHDDMSVPTRKPVSRRASNASNRSGGGHRFDHTSPATTLVSNHPVGKRRPRAKSIESTRWYEEQQMMMEMNGAPAYVDEMMVPFEKLRKSRSAARDLHSMRPVSAYNTYYDEGDELFDSQPTFYDNGYYNNRLDNMTPNKQQQQLRMHRYNPDIPYYPMPQPPQQQQQQQQYVYSPADYYYPQRPRHNGQRHNARHCYGYN